MSKRISNKITILNFIFTLCICCYHFRFSEFGFNKSFEQVKEFMGYLSMSFFFLISGLLLFSNANSIEDIKKKMYSRIFSLIVPYFIWNFVCMVINMFLIGDYTFSLTVVLKSLFWLPIDGPTWYLLAIFMLMLFSPLMIKLKKYKKTNTIIFASIIVLLYLRNIKIIPAFFDAEEWWWYYNTIGYLPYYLIGCYAGMYYKEFVLNRESTTKYCIISAIIFVSCVFLKVFLKSNYLSFFVNILLIISFWFSLPSQWFNSNLHMITQYSFFVYVLHIPVLIPLSCYILKLFCLNGFIYFYQFVLLTFVAGLMMFAICVFVVTLLKLIFIKNNKLFMCLSGNRVKNDFCKEKIEV